MDLIVKNTNQINEPCFAQITERFYDNYRGYWQAHGFLFIGFIFAIFCDAASTTYFLTVYKLGPEAELHPIFRWGIETHGPYIGPLLCAYLKLVAGLVVSIYLRGRLATLVLTGTIIISLCAAWYNIWGLGHDCIKVAITDFLSIYS